MSTNPNKQLSKFISMILRHRPGAIGIELDPQGWANVEELIEKLNQRAWNIHFDTLVKLVEQNDKQRFAFNADRTKIRANQGHSIPIDLGYISKEPPAILYHGTGKKYVASILKTGLNKQKRHHVHLSADRETAHKVGQRHGKPVIFEVQTGEMYRAGFEFFCSDNGVWLTDRVPLDYLILPE
ncbi:MAG: RNA 2'-phosphotransferase [Bacteroidota bacterium]